MKKHLFAKAISGLAALLAFSTSVYALPDQIKPFESDDPNLAPSIFRSYIYSVTLPELAEYIGTEGFHECPWDDRREVVVTPEKIFLLSYVQGPTTAIADIMEAYAYPVWCFIYTNTPMTEKDFPEIPYLASFDSPHYADLEFERGEGYAKDYKYYYPIQVDAEAFFESKQIKYPGGSGVPEADAALAGWFYDAYTMVKQHDDIAVGAVQAYFLESLVDTKTFTSTYGFGDINEDEQINVCDAILMSRVAAEEQGVPVTDKGKDNGDMNYDGVITAEDVMLLLKKLAKK